MKQDREGRITDENITSLKEGEVFVFGSNETGAHGAGAAKTAKELFGAEEGKGWGPTGQSFALPTKGWDITTLPIPAIECYAARFLGYAMLHPEKKFLVTEIGCGLAGYEPEQIAPLFAAAEMMKNISLPERFWSIIDKEYREDLIKYLEIVDDGTKNEL